MKKVIIILIVFAVVAFGATGMLIEYKNNKFRVGNGSGEIINGNNWSGNQDENVGGSKEKTIDLYGTYDENDLLFEDEQEEYMGVKFQFCKISGLKNKEVQNKINEDIRKTFEEELKNLLEQSTDDMLIEEISYYIERKFL